MSAAMRPVQHCHPRPRAGMHLAGLIVILLASLEVRRAFLAPPGVPPSPCVPRARRASSSCAPQAWRAAAQTWPPPGTLGHEVLTKYFTNDEMVRGRACHGSPALPGHAAGARRQQSGPCMQRRSRSSHTVLC